LHQITFFDLSEDYSYLQTVQIPIPTQRSMII